MPNWMGELTDISWALIGLLVFFGILQLLRAMAITVRNETMIHDLKVGVSKIQVEQFHAEMLRHGMAPTPDENADADVNGTEADPALTADGDRAESTPEDASPQAAEPIPQAA